MQSDAGFGKIVGTNFADTFTLEVNALFPDGNLEIDGGGGNDTIIGNDSENIFWGGAQIMQGRSIDTNDNALYTWKKAA